MNQKGSPGFKRLRTFAVLLTFVIALGGAQAFAQTTTATIRGTVIDESGNAFPGASIVATNTATGFTYQAAAGSGGSFNLAGLTPGTYKIDVTAPSYKGATREVTVQVGQTFDTNFRLTPDLVVMEQVTVVGSGVAVETRSPQIATNVTRQQIESLPQNDRNFLNFAALAPGVVLGNDEMRKEFRGGAQQSSAGNVYIDGVSFKNDVIQGGVVGQDSSRGNPFPQNAVQEFRVLTQNYSAEFEKASSAIITAVTKSGTNQFQGEVFDFYQNKSLVADDPLTGANPQYKRNQYGVSVGGPIIRDRLHFFGSYEANDQNREETVVLGSAFPDNTALRQQLAQYAGTFVSPFRSDLAFAKLSYQPASAHLFDLSFDYRKESDIQGFGGQTSYQRAENKKNDRFGTTLHHQFIAGTWLNEASAGYQDFNWNPKPLNPQDIGLIYEGLLEIGGRDTEQKIGQKRFALRDDVSFANIGGGKHALKVGVNAAFLDYTVTKHFEENPRYFFRSDISSTIPYKARYGFGNPDLSAANNEYGVYAQDDWSVNQNLILNLGLRWDYETNMMDKNYVTPPEIVARLGSQFPSKYFTDGTQRSAAKDMFQPRLGFSYDIGKTGQTVAFGGAGRYYDRNMFNNTLDERFRLQHSVGEFYFSADGSPVFGQPAVKWDPKYFTAAGLQEVLASGITGKPEVFLIENDTKVPYSDQWNLGVRHTFGSMLASLSYNNIRSYHGFTYLWGAGYCCPQFDPHYSNVLISSDDVKTWYDAVYFTLDSPYMSDRHYGWNLAYTWSDATQVGGDLFSLDLPKISDWPRYGTPGTATNRIVANGIVGIPWDVRLSTLIQYSSGDKFRIHDFSKGFCTGCYVPRTGESPAWTTIDLRGEKDFHLGPTSLGVILEAFNITNAKRYQYFNDFIPPEGNPNVGKGTAIVGGSQRRYQVGLRVAF